jgi:hypothetical protein
MSGERRLPWTDLLGAIGEERFAELRAALDQRKTDPLDRDAFVLDATAGTLLRDLVPDDAPPEAVNAYGALLHMMFLCWERDWPLTRAAEAPLRHALANPSPLAPSPQPLSICYIQLPERLVWAEPEPDAPHQPLDGVFVVVQPARARVLAVLGLHPGRVGFTTMTAEAALPASAPEPRPDGTAPFASMLPAGDRARLFSVVTEHELIALALTALAVSERTG